MIEAKGPEGVPICIFTPKGKDQRCKKRERERTREREIEQGQHQFKPDTLISVITTSLFSFF